MNLQSSDEMSRGMWIGPQLAKCEVGFTDPMRAYIENIRQPSEFTPCVTAHGFSTPMRINTDTPKIKPIYHKRALRNRQNHKTKHNDYEKQGTFQRLVKHAGWPARMKCHVEAGWATGSLL